MTVIHVSGVLDFFECGFDDIKENGGEVLVEVDVEGVRELYADFEHFPHAWVGSESQVEDVLVTAQKGAWAHPSNLLFNQVCIDNIELDNSLALVESHHVNIECGGHVREQVHEVFEVD